MIFAIGLILPFFIDQIPAVGKCSCHERLEAYYDRKVFLTIDPIEQIQRIEKRNGSEKAVEFQKKWIPLEELYFENAAPEAGAASVLQCVMRCRKIRYRIFLRGPQRFLYRIFLILHMNLLARHRRKAAKRFAIKILAVHINRRNLMIVIRRIIVNSLRRIAAGSIERDLILSVRHLAASSLLVNRI